MTTNTKKKRPYKHVTPQVISEFKAQVISTGNNTEAVRVTDSDYLKSASDRGYRIAKKGEQMNAIQYVDEQLQQISTVAVQRVGEMVMSNDEQIATRNSHFVIDHIRGKAVQRTDNRNLNISIESILE